MLFHHSFREIKDSSKDPFDWLPCYSQNVTSFITHFFDIKHKMYGIFVSNGIAKFFLGEQIEWAGEVSNSYSHKHLCKAIPSTYTPLLCHPPVPLAFSGGDEKGYPKLPKLKHKLDSCLFAFKTGYFYCSHQLNQRKSGKVILQHSQ